MKGKKWKRIAAAAFAAIVTLCTPLSGPAQGVEEASLPVRTLTLDTRSYSMAPETFTISGRRCPGQD